MHKVIERKILLNPGPATTTDTVKMAQVLPDICPREKEFQNIMAGIRHDLVEIVGETEDKYAAVLFGGSGTAGMEAVLSSVISSDKHVLILINGAYGKRMKQIAEIYDISNIALEYDSGTALDLNQVENLIIENSDIEYIAMVHHETTTGILNPLEKIYELGKKYNKVLIIDAISSYAGIPIDLKATPIDFLMSTSNKCIQGMAGLAFIICKKSKLDSIRNIPPHSFYLSLYEQYIYMEKTGQMRFTPPVQTIYALRQAIDEFFEEGGLNRYKRYTDNWRRLRKGLIRLGFKLLLDSKDESHILLTVIEPDNYNFNFNKMHDLLLERNFTIYPGKIKFKNTFRLANMGAINTTDIDMFLIEMTNVLKEIGIARVFYK